MKQQNFILIISSPSGAGKTSISKQLLANDSRLSLSVSATTRQKRANEKNGEDYFFVNKDQFDRMRDNDEFVEWAKVFDYYYGSPKQKIIDKLAEGSDVLFDVDWQGAQILKNKFGALVVSIFILPPSLAELESRLRKRQQDSDEVIDLRMDRSRSEISKYNLYDYVLINKDFDKTLSRITTIIDAERLRHFDFSRFVKQIIA